MKKLITLLFSAALLGFSVTVAQAAAEQATEAKVMKVKGSATAQIPGQSGRVPVTEGMTLPAGSSISTGSGSEVDIQTFAGGMTAIRANSTVILDELSVNKDGNGVVTKQTATLSLKSGNVIAALDPNRKAINNYSVRTPKGVAAARGTVLSVSVKIDDGVTSVATLQGTVTITLSNGTDLVVDIATGVVLGAGSDGIMTLADMVAAEGPNGETAQAIAAAVDVVATAVATNTISAVVGTNSDQAVSILAAVVKVASDANPAAAATFSQIAVDAVQSSTSSVSVNGGDVQQASNTVRQASSPSSSQSSDQSSTDFPIVPVDANQVSSPGTP